MNATLRLQTEKIEKIAAGKKILFASAPFDGHVNPLTGLAVHLKNLGYDVRWYTSIYYAKKISNLQITHHPFVKALDVRADNIDQVMPERKDHKSQIGKLNFDLINVFTLRGPEYYADILDIYKNFRFDCMIADCAFTGIPFVEEKMNIPVIAVGVFPLMETSKDLAPPGLGMTPSYTFAGRIKQSVLRWVADNLLFKKANKALVELCARHRLSYNGGNIFSFSIQKATLFLQSGTPGFEYKRSDLSRHIKFIGALLPYRKPVAKQPWFDERLNKYEKVILVTQGTVEKDVRKLLLPTLQAFKDTNVLVVATTGGSQTAALRERFPFDNIIIEDFIPFSDIMPYTDVFITNGGYGGVMMGIENEVPMVVAGIHEGKNEINARVGYFRLGINLRTEFPIPSQVRRATVEVMNNMIFKRNIGRLSKEFSRYDPNEMSAAFVYKLLNPKKISEGQPGWALN